MPNARVADLETLGVRVQDRGAGWYELRAPEGYSFRMPGVPLAEQERFSYAGKRVPQRFYDLTTEAGSRGFLVRVFDARELAADEAEALRTEALSLFLPRSAEIRERDTAVVAGTAVERLLVDGYSLNGHMGLIRSFVREGFVWMMLVVIAPASGVPTDADTFFQSALRRAPTARTAMPGTVSVSVPPTSPLGECLGHWTGTGTQLNGMSWPIDLVVASRGDGTCGTIEYPSLGCGGYVTRCAMLPDGHVSMREVYTHNAGTCAPAGEIRARCSAGRMNWTWTGPGETANATLTRM